MKTLYIRLRGLVQGVGFRPFVYQTATRLQLTGWVNNTLDGVHIRATGPAQALEAFLRALDRDRPALSRVADRLVAEVPLELFSGFTIIHSDSQGTPNLWLTPDLALCSLCREEIRQPGNRRQGYAFTTCNHCGPRYSILRELPYDRERTSMDAFACCPDCLAEYDNPMDRRYYAQTISCPACGVHMWLDGQEDRCLDRAAEALLAGQVLAVKGIGGYLLVCDARQEAPIVRIRRDKGRQRKPFALMYPDWSSAEADTLAGPGHRALLEGPAAPILLLPLRDQPRSGIAVEHIAPGLDQLGVMLPYAPLFQLLLDRLGGPVVATSANVHGSPIVHRDEQAEQDLAPLSAGILRHNREILLPQDDSVARLSSFSGKKIMLRRARGYAPTLESTLPWPDHTALAMGADLKSAFGLLNRRQVYISQYLGDMDQWDTQARYRETLAHFLRIFQTQPEKILADAHPRYFSAGLGRELSDRQGIPLLTVQHHEAHFAAVLGENGLLSLPEPVLGVIWDGTGYGTDGQVWGGEFFDFRVGQIRRVGQLAYFPFLLGDKMPREPRISALACSGGADFLRPKFTSAEWDLYHKMLQQEAPLQCSSMGRLFDAVCSVLGILDRSEYEGEAPLYLEKAARSYFRKNGLAWQEGFYPVMQPRALMEEMIAEVRQGREREWLAAKFHQSLVGAIEQQAREGGYSHIACSGGVFQNEVLVDLILFRLSGKFSLYFHDQLSPNDECIAFGQLVFDNFCYG